MQWLSCWHKVQPLDASPGGTTPRFFTASFYKFVGLPDHAALQAPLQAVCLAHRVKGLVLLAPEGINGGLSGAAADVQAVLDHLRQDPRLADLVPRTSWAEHAPYHRMKVRLKKEIVTMGVPGVDPAQMAGTYVAPQDWNALIADPAVVLIDTRNEYEVALGTFEGAINPHIDNFSQLPDWLSRSPAVQANDGSNPKWRCFARVASAAKNPPPCCARWALVRCSTCKVASFSIWRKSRPNKAAGMGSVLCLTSACPSAMVCSLVGWVCAAVAVNP